MKQGSTRSQQIAFRMLIYLWVQEGVSPRVTLKKPFLQLTDPSDFQEVFGQFLGVLVGCADKGRWSGAMFLMIRAGIFYGARG